jgi:DNA polymerase I
MDLKLEFNFGSLVNKEEQQKKNAAVQKAKEKKKTASETIEDAFDRIGELKFNEKELDLYKMARKAFFAGRIGRLGEGKLTKGEVLSMGKQVKDARELEIREQRIKQTVDNKPENFYVLTDDRQLPKFMQRVREEIKRQKEEWTDRWKALGVESMTAGDFEGTGIDSYMDLSIGFSIWLPILDEGYYLAYGHVDLRGVEGFEDLPVKYMHREGDPQLTRSKVIETISPYLSNPDHGKTFHMGSARYDLHIAQNDGYEIRGLKWDTLDAMHHLTEHLDSYGLKPITQRYGKHYGLTKEVFTFDDLFGKGSPAPYNTEIVGIYAIYDVLYGWKLMEWQHEQMKKTGNLYECFTMIDAHIPEVDVFMARAGFTIDLDRMAELEQDFTQKIEQAKRDVLSAYTIDKDFLRQMSMKVNGGKIEKWIEKQQNKKERLEDRIQKQQEIIRECENNGKTHLKKYETAIQNVKKYKEQLNEIETIKPENAPDFIHEFEFTNNGHIGFLIYDFLGIKDKTAKVQRGKTRSTAAAVLEMYYEDEESLKPLATVAAYEKLLGTYVRKIPNALELDGRFHCQYNSIGTATGRYSSQGYNGRSLETIEEFING